MYWFLFLAVLVITLVIRIGCAIEESREEPKKPEYNPPVKLKKTLFGPYTEQQWEDASPFAPGSRHVNPDTGKPWWKND